MESLVPFYRRFGCEVPPRSETPLYFGVLLAGAGVLRPMTHGRMQRVALMRYVPEPGGR